MTHITHMPPAAETIFTSAMDLFRKNGYSNTNVRQIAEQANLSLGLVNHYFESKRNLGYVVLKALIRYVVVETEHCLEEQLENTLLLDAAETRAVNIYLSKGPFRQFYLDTLEEDIFFHYLENLPACVLEQFQKTYGFSISRDMALLYGRYVPYMIEKTLVLKKAEGLFTSISEEDVPYHIFSSTYSSYISQDILTETDKQARQIVPHILEKLAPVPSMDVLKKLDLSDLDN